WLTGHDVDRAVYVARLLLELRETEWPDPEGVAHRQELRLGQTNQGIRPFYLGKCVRKTVLGRFLRAASDEVDDHLRVAGAVKDRTGVFKPFAQGLCVGEVAVVHQGELPVGVVDGNRLRVLDE